MKSNVGGLRSPLTGSLSSDSDDSVPVALIRPAATSNELANAKCLLRGGGVEVGSVATNRGDSAEALVDELEVNREVR